jgi:hypothetical protein
MMNDACLVECLEYVALHCYLNGIAGRHGVVSKIKIFTTFRSSVETASGGAKAASASTGGE